MKLKKILLLEKKLFLQFLRRHIILHNRSEITLNNEITTQNI